MTTAETRRSPDPEHQSDLQSGPGRDVVAWVWMLSLSSSSTEGTSFACISSVIRSRDLLSPSLSLVSGIHKVAIRPMSMKNDRLASLLKFGFGIKIGCHDCGPTKEVHILANLAHFARLHHCRSQHIPRSIVQEWNLVFRRQLRCHGKWRESGLGRARQGPKQVREVIRGWESQEVFFHPTYNVCCGVRSYPRKSYKP